MYLNRKKYSVTTPIFRFLLHIEVQISISFKSYKQVNKNETVPFASLNLFNSVTLLFENQSTPSLLNTFFKITFPKLDLLKRLTRKFKLKFQIRRVFFFFSLFKEQYVTVSNFRFLWPFQVNCVVNFCHACLTILTKCPLFSTWPPQTHLS